MKFIKKNQLIITTVIACLTVIFLFSKLGCVGGTRPTKDTISIRVDTILVPVQGEKILVPQPYAVYYPRTVEVEKEVPITVYIPEKVDTIEILNEYFAARLYSDTLATKYGNVVVNDTIAENRIKGRSLNYDFGLPVVTRQITLREEKRTVAFVGAGIWGNQSSLLYGTEVNLSLKNKQDKIFSLKGMLDRHGNVVYGFGVSVPIRLKKR
jgi:hypothetical protein